MAFLDISGLERLWQQIIAKIGTKADIEHTHTVSQISGLTATTTELNYMDGVTSNVQAQLNAKAANSHTHTVSQISGLTATTTELNFVDGVTSNIQSQLDFKASSSHGHTLTIIDGGDGYLTFTVGDAEAEVNTALEEIVNASY